MKRLLGTVLITVTVLLLGALLLIYSQGKRIDRNGKISGSGILQVSTNPTDAKIYLNGQYSTTSDTNIENLKKGSYTVRIEKDHYSTWEKVIEIKEGYITPIKATLYPSNPSLTAITFDGVYSPKLSNDNKSVVFGIQTSDKAGLWVLDLTDPQLFFDNRLRKIVSDSNSVQFSKGSFFWTADNKNIFVEAQSIGSTETKAYLLKATQENTNPNELGDQATSEKNKALSALSDQAQEKLAKFGSDAQNLAKDAKSLVFSKDNNAVIISKDTETIIYDKKPNLLSNPKPTTTILPPGKTYFFLQDDLDHIITVENNTLSVMDRDGTNKIGLFTGDFDPASVFSWPDGNRIVVSINLNSKQNPLPNLYTIDLK